MAEHRSERPSEEKKNTTTTEMSFGDVFRNHILNVAKDIGVGGMDGRGLVLLRLAVGRKQALLLYVGHGCRGV